MGRIFLCGLLAGWSVLARAACGPGDIELVGEPVLSVSPDTHTAVREMYLRNRCEETLSGAVYTDDFVSEITGALLGTSSSVSVLVDGSWQEARSVTVPAGADLLIKLNVTSLREAGESVASLKFAGRHVGDIRAQNYRVPFAVTVGPIGDALVLRRDACSALMLSNGNAYHYPVRWSLRIGGRATNGQLTLPPNGQRAVEFCPPEEWFDAGFSRLFKPEEVQAQLSLRLQQSGLWSASAAPARSIAVPVALESFGEGTKSLLSNAVILLLLVLGAVASLTVNSWVPNRFRRLALQQRIELIANRTREISEHLSSRLRVKLRVERNRESERLEKAWTFSPSFATVAAEVEGRLADIEGRVELACRIDGLISECESHPRIPVSRLEMLKQRLQRASRILEKTDAAPAELEFVSAQLADARARLTGDDETINKEIAENLFARLGHVRALNALLSNPRAAQYQPGELPLKPLLERVTAMSYAKAEDIAPRDFHEIDMTLLRAEILFDAIRIFEDSSQEHRNRILQPSQGNGTPTFMDILKHDYLDKQTAFGVRSAKLLVEQMREDVFASNIVSAIKDGSCIPSIEFDPPTPVQNRPVKFSIRFPRDNWDQAAAKGRLGCQWDFGDKLKERGWEVSHYFPDEHSYTVTATIRDLHGQPIESAGSKPITTTVNVARVKANKSQQDRNQTELVYMVVALGAAIIALASGARETLLQLDLGVGLLGMFLVGFGADSIKKLFTSARDDGAG